MVQSQRRVEEEMADLKEEINSFKHEKERVRKIIGRIGGVPTTNTRTFNVIFSIFLLGCLIYSLWEANSIEVIMVELAIAAVSVKLIFLMHSQMRVNHFQLWLLSSLEWRINELDKKLNKD